MKSKMLKTTIHMTQEQKEQIREALLRFTLEHPSQKATAEKLQGISNPIISLIKNKRWERISERMWQNIARQVGFYCGDAVTETSKWQQADTGAYLLLRILFGDAQRYSMAYGVAIQTGLGKTFCSKHYASEKTYTHYIPCTREMNRKGFLKSLLASLNKTFTGSTEQMMQLVVTELELQEEPLLIIDDAHLLKDRVLHFAVALYKRLINNCGVILLGNDELRTRVVEGARMQKQIYEEVYNTIGRRFVTLGQAGPKDVELVCRANAITNSNNISEIKQNSKGNLHEVTKQIIQIKSNSRLVNYKRADDDLRLTAA